jgi:internalin A
MESSSILDIIARAAEEKWKGLNLSGTDLLELPPEICQLTNLTSLNLSNNKINTLPESIGQLSNLTFLNLSNNKINTLPESIGQLPNLTFLELWDNQLSILPESIGKLNNLTSLNIGLNRLQELPASISSLSKIVALSVTFNHCSELQSIGNLTSINELDISGNQIKILPEWLSKLENITSLDLSYNQLETLPSWIGKLSKLKELKLTSNNLKSLPLELVQLKQLKRLHLISNELDIPIEITRKYAKPYLVLDFLRQLHEEGLDYIYEAKLLIIGQPGAGKTSLTNKLIDPNYQLKLEGGENPEKSTEGIDVLHFEFKHSSSNNFRVNIWDFGGQEIYHDTHQFFLTKRSLYLLVADTRQDNTDFNYWLEVVELLSESSPTIIVKNEKQNRPCQVNENQLRGRFPNLEKILPTNLFDNRGLPEILK